MLNPIDPAAVIRDGGAVGHYPGQIHEGVAWWLGACLVVTARTSRLAAAHDGQLISDAFADRLCRGAINAQHYACTVRHLGKLSEDELLAHLGTFRAPGAWLSSETTGDVVTVRIRLYTAQGALLDEANGLAAIRELIAQDHVPRPVNSQAKGTIEWWHPTATDGARP
ncbi:hypothetical protein ACIQVL_27705 [Streptomyces sp. NPDC090499]|uniref:hypothetical protein n=1 Tax=Streptomyces sp. NPDC090499 TaxID=3365965 RepID=UPI003825ACE6